MDLENTIWHLWHSLQNLLSPDDAETLCLQLIDKLGIDVSAIEQKPNPQLD